MLSETGQNVSMSKYVSIHKYIYKYVYIYIYVYIFSTPAEHLLIRIVCVTSVFAMKSRKNQVGISVQQDVPSLRDNSYVLPSNLKLHILTFANGLDLIKMSQFRFILSFC